MKQLVIKLLSTFDNNTKGLSARKLTAFAFVCCILYIHIKFLTPDNAIEALLIDLAGVLILFGLIKAEQLIRVVRGG